MKLMRSFYERSTLEVAKTLLGKYLVRQIGDRRLVGRIVETEAYVGPEDKANHASRGRTKRTEVMFGPAGYAYVYMIYGMHYCLNVVTEAEGYPAAVLIRSVEPEEGIDLPTTGPARLCKAMAIDRSLNGVDMTGNELYIEDRSLRRSLRRSFGPFGGEPTPLIGSGPRVGVDYSGEYANKPWRFWIMGNKFVSKEPRSATKSGE